MATRVVVVGADAAGMSAASQAKRLRGDEVDIVAFDRGTAASYSACGIPYWIAGDVKTRDDLIARTVEEHRRRGIYVHLRSEVTALDLDAHEVVVHDLERDRVHRAPYDELVLATGAVARRPPIDGIDGPGVYGVQTLDDGSKLLAGLESGPRTAVVIGGGYVGIEMAEALLRRGLDVTVLEAGPEPMSSLDPELGRLVRDAMHGMGIDVRTSTTARAIERSGDRVAGVVTDDRTFPADLVVLGLGVAPNTSLAREADLWLGPSGGLRTDRRMRVVDERGEPVPHLWAAGDCVEVQHRVSGAWLHIALGTHANKQGRALGTNPAAGTRPSQGSWARR
jgi:NADPH-dependent 2,4-dienoyl-CoA reductase/sulfur reductase-like enzyme